MQNHQTRFPYLLITRHEEVVARAAALSVDGVKEARGVFTFQADLPFEQVMAKLCEGMKEVGLLQIENHQYVHATGDLAQLIGHLN